MLAGALMGSASAASKCGTSTNKLVAPSNTVGSVNDGKRVTYKLVVPKGVSGYVNVQMLNGDLDLSVCKASTGTRVCDSHNQSPVPDGCHVGGGIPNPFDDAGYLFGWGSPLPAGTYYATITACWSSKDPDGCDYADPLGDGSGSPGALDPLPPVQFVITWVTN